MSSPLMLLPLLSLLLLQLQLPACQAGSLAFGDVFKQRPPRKPLATVLKAVHSSKESNSESSLQQLVNNVESSSSSTEWRRGLKRGAKGLEKFNFAKSSSSDSLSHEASTTGSESGSDQQRTQKTTKVNGKTVLNVDAGKASDFARSGQASNLTEHSSSSQSERSSKVSLKHPVVGWRHAKGPAKRHVKVEPQGHRAHPHHHLRHQAACHADFEVTVIVLVHAPAQRQSLYDSLSVADAFLAEVSHAGVRAAVLLFNRGVVGGLDSLDDPSLKSLRRGLGRLTLEVGDRLTDAFDLASAVKSAERLRRRLGGRAAALLTVAEAAASANDREAAEAIRALRAVRSTFDLVGGVLIGGGDDGGVGSLSAGFFGDGYFGDAAGGGSTASGVLEAAAPGGVLRLRDSRKSGEAASGLTARLCSLSNRV